MHYNRINFLQFVAFSILFLAVEARAEVILPKIFSNHMVLQREQPIPVWGKAAPNEKVQISLAGESVSIKADKNGKWKTFLPAMQAGGPYTLTINGSNEIKFDNVLIGDVWICSGQSNMEWRIRQTQYEEEDTLFINRARIRLFTVAVDIDYMQREDVKNGSWKTLNKENINEFSAVAYHFGKFLNEHINVPIGLINVSMGATSIETWMSNEALMEFPQFKEIVEPIVQDGKSFDQLNAEFEKIKPEWYKNFYYKGPGIDQEWYKPETDVSNWKPMAISGNTWEETELKNHDGAVWFRTTFDLPENFNQESYLINLLQIDDYDITWVNGVKVGENYGKHNHRSYHIPKDVLKPKNNVMVVRVFDAGGIGGFTTHPFWGNPILHGNWIYKKGLSINADKFPKPKVPNATPFSSPGVLYNANIAPLTLINIKGVIWYQGEGNAVRAYEYRELFPAMIKDWRKKWNQEALPFLFVQLANYNADPWENKSTWPELREAQAMALQLPKTGMATAIDIGESDDIHPENKLEVGRRLGLAALKIAYDKDLVYSGPTFKEMSIKDDKITIAFDHIGEGLKSRDKHGYIRGFKIAGEDQVFHWAKAHIEGDKVVVYHELVKDPVAVRYAWDNDPGPLDLYNKEGLPAVPFRTDDWEGVTEGLVFKDGPRF